MSDGSEAGRVRQFNLVRGALLGVFALWFGYQSFAASAVNFAHRRQPDFALRFHPDDPAALNTRMTRRLAEAGNGAIDAKGTQDAARASLRGQALNPQALRLLGLGAASAGNIALGQRAMTLADRMTRRDLPAQLWLIEAAVSRGDVPAALKHYDSALRTSAESQQLLLPVLTTAMQDPALWPGFVPYIRAPAPWLGDFARNAIRNGARPEMVARLIMRAGGLPNQPVFAALEGELLKRLVEAGAFADAAAYYRTLKGADPAVLGSAGLSSASIVDLFTPISWELYTTPGISSTFLSGDAGGIEIDTVLESAVSGAIARKLVLISPGRYRFHAAQRLAAASAGAGAAWEIYCGNVGGSSRLLWRGAAPLTDQRAGVDAEFDVPAGCPAITIRLLANAGSEGNGAEFIFSGIALRKK